MKKLYLALYFNENEQENDADVIVIDDEQNQHNAFKVFFKDTYEYEIKDEHIINIYPVTKVFDMKDGKYEVILKEIT
jgi:hypothetical protein